jgi:hypothetical protein
MLAAIPEPAICLIRSSIPSVGVPFVEEHVQCSFGPAGSGPHEAAGVVINNNDQVAVPAFVRDLIDPDPTQTGEAVDGGFDVAIDAAEIWIAPGWPCDSIRLAVLTTSPHRS